MFHLAAIYNAHIMFWTGVCTFSMTALMPVALVSLTIDRCWIIIVGIISSRKELIFSRVVMCVSLFFGCFTFYILGNTPPKDSATNCTGFGCLVTLPGYRAFNTYKMVAGACNFIAGVTFITLWRIRRKVFSNKSFSNIIEERKKRAVSLDLPIA